jgi:hypothetical protein
MSGDLDALVANLVVSYPAGQATSQDAVALLSAAWSGLPFTHRFNGHLADPEATARAAQLGLAARTGSGARQALGTDGCLFCAVGVAPYWDPPLVLIFGPMEALGAPALIAPWDTRGAATEVKRQKLPPAELIRAHTLPAHQAAVYLPQLWARCFRSALPYLDGNRPTAPDPAGVWAASLRTQATDKAPLFAAEARFPGGLEVRADQLIAVLADEDKITGPLRPSRLALQRFVERGGGKYLSLRSTAGAVGYGPHAQAIILEHLRDTGYLS